MHYIFQHMSTITKLSQDVTQYYKNIISPDRRNCENTKRYTGMYSTKDALELQKKNSRDEQRGWEDGTPDGLPMIHVSTAHL